ncbi:MAG: hypothetical protein WCB02_28095 [Bradyrhizobium sp.]
MTVALAMMMALADVIAIRVAQRPTARANSGCNLACVLHVSCGAEQVASLA